MKAREKDGRSGAGRRQSTGSQPADETSQGCSAADAEAKAEAARAKEKFVEDLLIRGEAAKAKEGKLPPGATHEIVEETEKGLPEVRRRRFSAY
jgi:hypothetical protein